MTTQKSIASFNSYSLTTKNFRWLNRNTWDGAQTLALSHLLESTGIIPQIKATFRSKRMPALFQESWYLTPSTAVRPSILAELQGRETTYSLAELWLTPLTPVKVWDSDKLAAISLLISSVLLTHSCDQIKLIGVPELMHHPGTQGWGVVGPIATPPREILSAERPPKLRQSHHLTISNAEWWKLDSANADRETLAYLIKRKERREALESEQKAAANRARRPRGLLSRLFFPGR